MAKIINKKEKNKIITKKQIHEKDSILKIVFQDPARFAEVFNKKIFSQQYLNVDDLKEADPTETAYVDNIVFQKHRDVLKMLYKNKIFAILGIENQNQINYMMPLRLLHYNCLNYLKQCDVINKNRKEKLIGDEYLSGFSKNDKLNPVITLVIYYGNKEWDGPRCLKDMLYIEDNIIDEVVCDFPMYIIDVRHLSKTEIEDYDGEIKALFGFLSNDKNKEELEDFVKSNSEIFSDLSKDIIIAINKYSDFMINEDYISQEGGTNMCKAIEDMKAFEREKGREEGKAEMCKAIEQIALNLLKNNVSKEQVILATGLTAEKLSELEEKI